MPAYSSIVSDRREPSELPELLVKAIVLNGCDPVQAGNVVVAKRGMQGISWGLEINFQVEQEANGSSIIINGTIGGAGPIQKKQLRDCADSIIATLKTVVPGPGSGAVITSGRSQEIDDIYKQALALDRSLGDSCKDDAPKSKERPHSALRPVNMMNLSLDSTTLLLTKDFTPQEQIVFASEYNANKKSVTMGVLLALLLGGIGVHKFWLGSTGAGLLYLFFFWTFIPALVAIIDACLMGNSVQRYNSRVANNAYQKIMMMR